MFSGLYLNLAKRKDRRAHMERELDQFGVAGRYRRLLAIPDAEHPAKGCYRSHLKALDEARHIGGPVHVLEDDSILSAKLLPFLESERLPVLLERFDLLFLDMWVDPQLTVIERYDAARRDGLLVFDGTTRVGAMSSYLIAPRSTGKMRRLWNAHKMDGTPIDVLCGELVKAGKITAAVVVPFLTGVDFMQGTASDIQKKLSRVDQRRLVMLRTRFFVDKSRQPAI